MKLSFSDGGWDDYLFWQQNDRKILKRINKLFEDIDRGDPYEGIGKPEPLKHGYSGCWARRITGEHRLIYRIENDMIEVIKARLHYD